MLNGKWQIGALDFRVSSLMPKSVMRGGGVQPVFKVPNERCSCRRAESTAGVRCFSCVCSSRNLDIRSLSPQPLQHAGRCCGCRWQEHHVPGYATGAERILKMVQWEVMTSSSADALTHIHAAYPKQSMNESLYHVSRHRRSCCRLTGSRFSSSGGYPSISS